jgi:hypothetical protein
LNTEEIKDVIDRLDVDTIRMVAFTGGEPMLLGDKLLYLIQSAKRRGFVTRLVTSAYFGKHVSNANAKVEKLKSAGLDEISISWDDFHEEFVDFSAIHNVYWAAKRRGITAAVNIVQTAQSKWTAAVVREALGLDASSDDTITESPINLTGRAETELKDTGLRPERTVGPCPYVVTGPTLSAKNKLLACCGVIQDTPQLVLDENFRPENLESALEKSRYSPLLMWLYLRGPYAIMEYISKKSGVHVPSKEEVGGNCEACRRLFHDEQFSREVDAAVQDKAAEIVSELELLEALGMARPRDVLLLWAEKSAVRPRKAA